MGIIETTFGPKRYLSLKKSISIAQITDKAMYESAGKKLGAYMNKNGLTPTGPWTVVYFTWDQAGGKTDIGVSFPIDDLKGVTDSELSIVDIAKSKAAMGVLEGSYDGLGKTHSGLMKYVEEKGFDSKGLSAMAIEEYVVDPMSEDDPTKWRTNIYYLHN